MLPAIFPQQWQDNFINSWGILNLTLPTLASLPPFDIAWRVVSSPLQISSKKSTPIFYPTARIPFRFIGVSPGVSFQRIPDDFINLSFVHEPQFEELIVRISEHTADNELEAENPVFSNSTHDNTSALAQVSFYLGGRFVSENTLRHARHTMRFDGSYSVPFTFRSELNLWEYAGSFRYNLSGGGFRPSLIAGYGLSWYRVEQASTNGTPLAASTTPWVRRPSLGKLKHFLPNTLHVGVGIEFITIKSFGGLDVSLSSDYRVYTHQLGVDLRNAPLARFIELGIEPSEFLVEGRVWRHTFNGLFTISF